MRRFKIDVDLIRQSYPPSLNMANVNVGEGQSKIFEIVATENLCFDTTHTAPGDVVFKISGTLVLATIVFKHGGYECRRRSKLKYLKS